MSREILFRGKRIDNGEWVEGYYAVQEDKIGLKIYNILISNKNRGYFEWMEVDPSTVCQYTGLTDKN